MVTHTHKGFTSNWFVEVPIGVVNVKRFPTILAEKVSSSQIVMWSSIHSKLS